MDGWMGMAIGTKKKKEREREGIEGKANAVK
jgi:hypothetical protein